MENQTLRPHAPHLILRSTLRLGLYLCVFYSCNMLQLQYSKFFSLIPESPDPNQCPSDSCIPRKLHFLLCPLVVVLVQPTALFPVSAIAAFPTVSVDGGIGPTHCFLSCVSHFCINLIHVCFENCISYCVHWWGYWSNPLLSFLCQPLLYFLLCPLVVELVQPTAFFPVSAIPASI